MILAIFAGKEGKSWITKNTKAEVGGAMPPLGRRFL
jgi:hypothetical protein